MEKDETPFLKTAMHYGMLLGLFWMFKYLFFIGSGFTDHVFIWVFYMLNAGTFFAIYIIYNRYRMLNVEKPRDIPQCVLFIVAVCFFASFFEGALMYMHYLYINPNYFFQHIPRPALELIRNIPATTPLTIQIKALMTNLFSLRGTYIVLEFIRNIFIGFFIALFVGVVSQNINKMKK